VLPGSIGISVASCIAIFRVYPYLALLNTVCTCCLADSPAAVMKEELLSKLVCPLSKIPLRLVNLEASQESTASADRDGKQQCVPAGQTSS
jgi:hypothetical protein